MHCRAPIIQKDRTRHHCTWWAIRQKEMDLRHRVHLLAQPDKVSNPLDTAQRTVLVSACPAQGGEQIPDTPTGVNRESTQRGRRWGPTKEASYSRRVTSLACDHRPTKPVAGRMVVANPYRQTQLRYTVRKRY